MKYCNQGNLQRELKHFRFILEVTLICEKNTVIINIKKKQFLKINNYMFDQCAKNLKKWL